MSLKNYPVFIGGHSLTFPSINRPLEETTHQDF